MRNDANPRIIPVSIFIALGIAAAQAWADFQEVTFKSTDGLTLDGSLFAVEGAQRVVIFAHGAVFDKTSWYPQAEKLRAMGVAALTFNFRGYGASEAGPRADLKNDVLGAIGFAKARGYTKIALVGGSMGGAAVLDAVDSIDAMDPIDRVVLLAPAGGAPAKREGVGKLFLVADGDPLRDGVTATHAASAEPKALVVFPGSAHAQHVFKTEQGAEVEAKIIEFLTK
jgi:alpha-beta hydrolase superfamily lysophospholipase